MLQGPSLRESTNRTVSIFAGSYSPTARSPQGSVVPCDIICVLELCLLHLRSRAAPLVIFQAFGRGATASTSPALIQNPASSMHATCLGPRGLEFRDWGVVCEAPTTSSGGCAQTHRPPRIGPRHRGPALRRGRSTLRICLASLMFYQETPRSTAPSCSDCKGETCRGRVVVGGSEVLCPLHRQRLTLRCCTILYRRCPVPCQAPSPPGAAPGAPATDPGSRQAITIFGCTGKSLVKH